MDMIPKECKKLPPVEIFDQMLSSFDVVVLLDGTNDHPSTEESKSVLQKLKDNSVKYVSVDYSTLEQEVKDHISTVHGVSTAPYIFLKQKPFGNGETLQKVIDEGSLEAVIPEGSRQLSLNDKLKKLISKFDAVP